MGHCAVGAKSIGARPSAVKGLKFHQRKAGMTTIDRTFHDPGFEAHLRAELDRRMAVTPAMLHSIDEKGLLISVSDAWLAKLGYSREEVIGRRSSEFLTEESRQRAIRDVLPEFFRSGRCDNVEYQMVAKDGRVIDVLLSAVLDEDPAGVGRVSLAVITDVTALKQTKRQLSESEARYRSLVEDQSELVSLAAPDGALRYVNHAYAAFHGVRPEDMIGASLYDFVPAEERAALAQRLAGVCASRERLLSENRVVQPNGETRWIAWSNRALTDEEGRVTAIHSVGHDIEERVAAERLLKLSEARYRLLADNSSDMVFQLDSDLVRTYVSPASSEILGYAPEELIGVAPVAMAHPDDAARLELVFRTLMAGHAERQSVINRIRHRDGRWIWVEAHLRALKNPQTGAVTGIVGALRDISTRKAVEDELAEANRRLQALAGIDALTGLANRRAFDDALARETRRAQRDGKRLGLVMIDVDWFKAFNDRYGHPAGDDCLRRISLAIASVIQRPGDLAARYGGEEFVVLLPDTDEAGAAMIAEKIRQAVHCLALQHVGSADGLATISAGVAAGGDSGAGWNAESLVQAADDALYGAKASGRNAVRRASAKPIGKQPSAAA
jgi:diguanylate cyclase (GGDEF)-like protein/PAS domain S-box-containing protein